MRALRERGHDVLVEMGAGEGSGFSDESYKEVGADLVSSRRAIFDRADMVVKVKEPAEDEPELLKAGQIIFTFLHLAAEPELTERLVDSGVTAIAYETVESPDGALPLLKPMSEVAGQLAAQEVLYNLLPETDVLVGAVLLHGARAPKLVSRDGVCRMQKGSVIVDISIDQGGCIETARPTTHDDPVYEEHGVTHYCVTNMPVSYRGHPHLL